MIALYGLGLASPAALVALPTTLFLVVYLGCMTSAVRVLRGRPGWRRRPPQRSSRSCSATAAGPCSPPALVALAVLAWPAGRAAPTVYL